MESNVVLDTGWSLMGEPAAPASTCTLPLFLELLQRLGEPAELFEDRGLVPLMVAQDRLLPRMIGTAWRASTGAKLSTSPASVHDAAKRLIEYLNALVQLGESAGERLRGTYSMDWLELKLFLRQMEHVGFVLDGARFPRSVLYDPCHVAALGEVLLGDGYMTGAAASPLRFLHEAAIEVQNGERRPDQA